VHLLAGWQITALAATKRLGVLNTGLPH